MTLAEAPFDIEAVRDAFSTAERAFAATRQVNERP